MDIERYKKDLNEAKLELFKKMVQRKQIDKEIAQLRQNIGSLSQLIGVDNPLAIDMGLSDACREVLIASNEPLTAAEIQEGLERIGYPVENHENILASIHTTVRRLKDIIETTKEEKKAYKLSENSDPHEEAKKRIRKNWNEGAQVFEPILPPKK